MSVKRNYRRIFYLKNLLPLIGVLVASLVTSRTLGQSNTWISPKDADNVKNPLAVNTTVLADGKTLYVTYCSPCHGDKGKGDGPASSRLNTKPADHTSATVQAESDGSLFWKLSTGRNPMPGFQNILSDQQRWELVIYIRSLVKNAKDK